MTVGCVRVTSMGRAAGAGISRAEFLWITGNAAAQTAAHTDGVMLNNVVFRIDDRTIIPITRIMVVLVARQGPRRIARKRNPPIDIAGNRVAVDGRRAAAGDSDAPIVAGDQVMKDMRVGVAGDGCAVAPSMIAQPPRRMTMPLWGLSWTVMFRSVNLRPSMVTSGWSPPASNVPSIAAEPPPSMVMLSVWTVIRSLQVPETLTVSP